MSDRSTRRQFLLAGSLGLAAGASFALAASAKARASKGMPDIEKANVKLMKAFWADWNSDHLDIDKLVARYFAADALVRWSDDTPMLNGAQAAAAAAKASMPAGSRALIRIDSLYAQGPMVACHRLDTIRVPGKADTLFDTAGVSFLKDGKIVEYADYIIR
jgi:limonene-1,2-epoxide hydrolase